MDKYDCTIRTNYFRVRDEKEFKAFMLHIRGSKNTVQIWERKNAKGDTMFSFGAYGKISGVFNKASDDPDNDDYDAFIEGLQEHVAEDDAIIILEAGHKELSLVKGSATVITSDKCSYHSLINIAKAKAAEWLPGYRRATEF